MQLETCNFFSRQNAVKEWKNECFRLSKWRINVACGSWFMPLLSLSWSSCQVQLRFPRPCGLIILLARVCLCWCADTLCKLHAALAILVVLLCWCLHCECWTKTTSPVIKFVLLVCYLGSVLVLEAWKAMPSHFSFWLCCCHRYQRVRWFQYMQCASEQHVCPTLLAASAVYVLPVESWIWQALPVSVSPDSGAFLYLCVGNVYKTCWLLILMLMLMPLLLPVIVARILIKQFALWIPPSLTTGLVFLQTTWNFHGNAVLHSWGCLLTFSCGLKVTMILVAWLHVACD